MAKQLTKEEFIEVAKEFGYNTDSQATNYIVIYLNNERNANNLIAWLDAETKRGVCYDIRLDCMAQFVQEVMEEHWLQKKHLKII